MKNKTLPMSHDKTPAFLCCCLFTDIIAEYVFGGKREMGRWGRGDADGLGDRRPWEEGRRQVGIRLRGKSGLRGCESAKYKSKTAQTRSAQTAVQSYS